MQGLLSIIHGFMNNAGRQLVWRIIACTRVIVYHVSMVQSVDAEFGSMPSASTDVLDLIIALCSNLSDEPIHQKTGGNSVSSGAKLSFEAALREYHKRVYNLTYRLIGDKEEAADLTQETFVKAYRAFSKFTGPTDAVYPWLCKIAVNCCKNRFKELNRKIQHEGISLDQTTADGSSRKPDIADSSSDPAGIFERRDLDEKIQEAIQALPPDFRLIVALRDMNGLSYKEITEATGLTLEIVKTRLFRGRETLRKRLSHYVAG